MQRRRFAPDFELDIAAQTRLVTRYDFLRPPRKFRTNVDRQPFHRYILVNRSALAVGVGYGKADHGFPDLRSVVVERVRPGSQ